jgi:NAD+ diphosphatase
MPSRLDLGPKPHLGYTDSRLERIADRRPNDAAIATFAADPRARAYVIGGELIVMKKCAPLNEPLFPLEKARALGAEGETVFLGQLDQAPLFGIGMTPAAVETLKTRDDLVVTDLRSVAVQGLVDGVHLPPIAEAKAVLHWHARHRFCSNCGAITVPVCAGWRRDCPQCKGQHFPRTDPVAIMLTVTRERCVLGRGRHFAPGMYSALAGFIEPGETIEAAVRRETFEEAGIRLGRVVYHASQPWPFPYSLMIGCFGEALNEDISFDGAELEDCRWFSRGEVRAILAGDGSSGIFVPPKAAIAHHLIRTWAESE